MPLNTPHMPHSVRALCVALLAAFKMRFFTQREPRFAQQDHRTQTLFNLYRLTSETYSRKQALDALQQELEKMLSAEVAFFFPPTPYSNQVESASSSVTLADVDRNALTHSWIYAKPTGIYASCDQTAWRFEPMSTPSGKIGVLGVKPNRKTKPSEEINQLLADIALQTAMILQQFERKHSMEETRFSEERDNLRGMLMSSVSHDFKTPLAGIIGALSVYRSLGKQLSEQKRDALIETAMDEAQRLDNFITNMLDMGRLESGGVQLRKEWHNPDHMIQSVLRRMQTRCRKHVVNVTPCMPNIEVAMDIAMTEQAIQNILDNACKYTQAGTRIDIRCRAENMGFLCEIHDFGAGIPEENLKSIFDKYTRLRKKDMQVAGTGLGLAIAKASMEAQGGWIAATNHPEGGALFTLCLPEWRLSEFAANLNRKEGEHVAF